LPTRQPRRAEKIAVEAAHAAGEAAWDEYMAQRKIEDAAQVAWDAEIAAQIYGGPAEKAWVAAEAKSTRLLRAYRRCLGKEEMMHESLIAELRGMAQDAQQKMQVMSTRHVRYPHYEQVARVSDAAADALEAREDQA
jgi:hypothetical protein